MARALSDLWRHPNPDALAATWRACRSPAGERWSLAAFCGPCRLGTICPWHSTLHQPQPAVRFSKRAKLAKHQPLPNSSAQLVFCRRQTSLPSLAYSQVQPGHWVWGAWSQHWRAPAEWCWWAQQGAVARGLKKSLRIVTELWQEGTTGLSHTVGAWEDQGEMDRERRLLSGKWLPGDPAGQGGCCSVRSPPPFSPPADPVFYSVSHLRRFWARSWV